MDDFRHYPKGTTRQLVDFNRFVSLTGEKQFLCLDRGIVEICRYLLNSRGNWRTTYYLDNTPVGYTIPTEEQFELVTNAIAEANEDMTMATCDEIVNALDRLTSATIKGSGCGSCGGGSRGAGATEEAPNPYNQEETPTTPPPGFSSMEQFDGHKCNAAQDIVNALMQDLQGLAGINYIGSSIPLLVEAAITVLLTPIPYDDVVFLVSLLLFTAIEYTFLVLMSDVIFTDNDNLVCILYNSPDTIQAQSEFRTRLDELVDLQSWATVEKDFVKAALDHMTPTDAFNNMFTNQPTVSQEADCSSCDVVCLDYLVIENSGYIATDLGGGLVQAVFNVTNDRWEVATYLRILSTYPPLNYCGSEPANFTVAVTSGTVAYVPNQPYRILNRGNSLTYDASTPPVDFSGAGFLIVNSSSAFTIQMTWDD